MSERDDMAALRAENERLKTLLRDASNRLFRHHEASVWDNEHARRHGYTCPICTNKGGPNIFEVIDAALAPAPEAPR